ncbi:unnamed protein product [Colias eurytheme]|nr:unnamed protein product [Colias eurytheme]
MSRESAVRIGSKKCSVVLERVTDAMPTPIAVTSVTEAAAESDSANSMASMNSQATMSPLVRREALCTPKESRFWRCRKRSRLDDGSSSDTSIASGRKPRTGYRKAHRVEKNTEEGVDLGVPASADPEPKSVLTPSIALQTNSVNASTEDVRRRIETNLATVEKIAKVSNHLKTTFVADLRNAAKAIREDTDSLALRTLTDETRALRAENERLRIRLDLLQNEMREMRLLMHRGPAASAQTAELTHDFEARMVRQLGEIIDARLRNLEAQPSLQQKSRHSIVEDGKGSRVAGIQQQSCSEPSEDMGPRPRKAKTLSKLTRDVTEAKEGSVKKKGQKKQKKNKKGAENEGQTVEPASTFSPAVVVSSRLDAESPTEPAPISSSEGWSVVGKKGKASAKKVQQPGFNKHTTELRRASQAPRPTQSRLRAPRSAAVVLTIPTEARESGATYAAAIKEARSKIDLKEAGIECVKFRQAVTGATIIQISGPDSSDKADLLSVKLKTLFKDRDIKVSRPVKMADVRVSGLDASITMNDLKEAVAVKGGCPAEQIRVSQLQKDRSGLYAAWVNCPITAAKNIAETRFLVGWVAARVKVQKPRVLRCYRCLEVGHVANRCTSECDRSQLCYRCGQPDHKAVNCTAKPNCTICAAAGKKADHRLGGSGCSVDKVTKERPNKHTVGPQEGGADMEIVETVKSLAQWSIHIGILSEPYAVPPGRDNWIGDIDEVAAIVVTQADGSPTICAHAKGHGCVAARFADIIVIGAYFSPNKTLSEFEAFLGEVCSLIQWGRPHQIIIAGDLNAKSVAWGSSASNARGDVLLEWLAAQNLVPLNLGNENTCVRMQGGSVVDVTFASPTLAGRIRGWQVLSEVETLSDHKYIRFEVLPTAGPTRNTSSAPIEAGPRWSLKSLNGNLLELASLIRAWCPRPDTINVDAEADWFGETMAQISDAAMSRLRRSLPRNKVYWWSMDLARLRSTCVTARRQYTKYRRRRRCADYSTVEEAERYAAYQNAKKSLRESIAVAKERAWAELLDTLNLDPWGRPYRLVMNKLRPWAPPITAKLEPALLKKVITTLFPGRNTIEPADRVRCTNQEERISDEIIPDVSSAELKAAVDRLQRKTTAPGPDGVHGRVWSLALSYGLDQRFRVLLTECFKSGRFPERWKVGRLVLLKKSGKPADLPSAYRPIVLLNEAGKLFERIIANRIQNHLARIGPDLEEAQYGFRRGRSTVDAIARLRDIAEGCVSQGGVALAISLDISNAFNTLPWDKILDGLSRHRLPSYLRRIISSYLRERQITFPRQDGWGRYRVERGVPQGSVLGPLLWNIGYNHVLRGGLPQGVTAICYADDTLVVSTGRDFREARLRATAGVAQVVARIKSLGLKVALDKSEAICFHGHRRAPQAGEEIVVSGVPIRIGPRLKYLGLVLDPRWTFQAHFSALGSKLTTTAAALCRIMPNIGGPSGACRRLFAGVVRSQALYGCPIWADKLLTRNTIVLRRSQRVIAIRVARAYRTVSYDAVCVIAGTAPWHLEAAALAEVYWRRVEVRERDEELPSETLEGWKREARDAVFVNWSREINSSCVGAWTLSAISPVLREWVERRWGPLSYRLVQVLSGHGCFGSYLHRIGREPAPTCHHCSDQLDTAHHTLAECPAWTAERRALEGLLGEEEVTLRGLAKVMISGNTKWKTVVAFCEAVMKAKEVAERARENDPTADPLRRRRPGRRRRLYAQHQP